MKDKLKKALDILISDAEFNDYYGNDTTIFIDAINDLKDVIVYLDNECKDCHLMQSWQNHIESMRGQG